PSLVITKGSLSDRYQQMSKSEWGMSTNIEATYKMLLDTAVSRQLPQEQMPTMLLILSDMQFNAATGTGGHYNSASKWNPTAQQMAEDMYNKAGYKMPKIVYWNL